MDETIKRLIEEKIIAKTTASILEEKSSKLQTEGSINVHFFVSQKQFWSLESVYRALEAQGCFNLYVVPFPTITHTKEETKKNFDELCAFHKERGAHLVLACTVEEGVVIPPEELDLDIVIYEQHWVGNYPFEYRSFSMCTQALCLCFPYGIMCANIPQSQFNGITHNVSWYNFVETPLHYKMSMQHALNKGVNTVVSGYPKLDAYKQPITKNYWQTNSPKIKRIIWAPHYSINTGLDIDFSTFLDYADYLFNFVRTHPEQLEIVLKPHPNLKSRWLKLGWTEKDFDTYMKQWNALPNASVVTDGNYIDLFKTSDAMILDSISFIAEYLVSGKPMCFLSKYPSLPQLLSHFNDFGKKAISCIDVAYNIDDVCTFITSVLNETASITEERVYFVDNMLKINFGHVGEYVADYILKKLKST